MSTSKPNLPGSRWLHPMDLVRIADDLGPSMSHFQAGCDAIVIGSYADQYGGTDHHLFTLFLRGTGTVSWYHVSQLTLLERNRADLLKQWQDEIVFEQLQTYLKSGKAALPKTHTLSELAGFAVSGIEDTFCQIAGQMTILGGDFLAKYCEMFIDAFVAATSQKWQTTIASVEAAK